MDLKVRAGVSRPPVDDGRQPRAGRAASPQLVLRAVVVALVGLLLSAVAVSPPAQAASRGEYVRGGIDFNAGDFWTSNNGRYQLVMQTDGNLVLYDQWQGIPIWASNTQGRTSGFLSMRNDGRADVWVGTFRVWSSAWSFGSGGRAFMKVQDDGKLVIYKGTPEAAGPAFSWNCIWNPNRRPNVNFCLV